MLVNRYGCRVVTAVGAVLAAFGLAISAAANSLVLLYFSIGVCTGNLTIFAIYIILWVELGWVGLGWVWVCMFRRAHVYSGVYSS